MRELVRSPRADGFHMPGEFEKHEATLILWPERPDNWRNGAKPAQLVFADLINRIQKYEQVYVGVSPTQYMNAKYLLDSDVKVIEITANDSWVRDNGPTFISNDHGDIRAINWGFNAWGGEVDGLYYPWDQDQLVATKFCEVLGVKYYDFEQYIFEGGSFHVDGEGTLITTKACLLSPGRNPQLNQNQIEEVLKDALGIEKIIWLDNGIYLDETNEHVDNIIHYVAPAQVVLSWTEDENDPQYLFSKKALEILENTTDAKGRKIKVHKLLLPKPILISRDESLGVDYVKGTLPRNENDRLAASYANFYIANNAIFIPQFGDENDKHAVKLLAKIFEGYNIEPISAREILLGGGNIHCITQQVPAKE